MTVTTKHFAALALAAALTAAVIGCAGDDGGGKESADSGLDAGRSRDAQTGDASDGDVGSRDAALEDSGADAMPGSDAGGSPSPSDAGSESLIELAAAFAAELDTHAERLCVCYELYGHESEEGCLGPPMSDDADACAQEAFALDPEGSRMFLQCALEAARKFTECLQEDPVCDTETFQRDGSCSMTYAARYEACGVLPVTVEDALASCGILGF